MQTIYSYETTSGRKTLYHGYIVTPHGIKLTSEEAANLIEHFVHIPSSDAHITSSVLQSCAQIDAGIYIGSGEHKRKLASLTTVFTIQPSLIAIDQDGNVTYAMDIKGKNHGT